VNRSAFLAAVVSAGVIAAGCEREARSFENPPTADPVEQSQTQLYAGAPLPPDPTESPYHGNAFGISEGKRLFSAYNCVGCHAHGGGGIGPPLMDDQWIYGYYPANIYATIVEGRPNGMPSFRGKMPDHQVWQLVAYIESMGGHVPLDALPGRDDHMRASPPPLVSPESGQQQTGHR
jgi:cytochrome c oxidase cbb3-type subunit 3